MLAAWARSVALPHSGGSGSPRSRPDSDARTTTPSSSSASGASPGIATFRLAPAGQPRLTRWVPMSFGPGRPNRPPVGKWTECVASLTATDPIGHGSAQVLGRALPTAPAGRAKAMAPWRRWSSALGNAWGQASIPQPRVASNMATSRTGRGGAASRIRSDIGKPCCRRFNTRDPLLGGLHPPRICPPPSPPPPPSRGPPGPHTPSPPDPPLPSTPVPSCPELSRRVRRRLRRSPGCRRASTSSRASQAHAQARISAG